MTEEKRCEPPPEWRDRDGWHWVERHDLSPVCRYWSLDGDTGLPSNAPGWANLEMRARGWRYLAPVTPPAVVAALVEALEGLMVGNAHRPAGYDYDLGMYLPATWPTKSIPSDDALSAARAALALYRGEAGR